MAQEDGHMRAASDLSFTLQVSLQSLCMFKVKYSSNKVDKRINKALLLPWPQISSLGQLKVSVMKIHAEQTPDI